jgi:hypothetical protein
MLKESLKLYSIAKIINYEVFLEGQIQSAGSRQEKYLESLEKHSKNIKYSVVAMKVVYAFVFSFLPIFPLLTYFEIKNILAGSYLGNTPSIEPIIFTGSILFSIYFGLMFLYLLLLGILNVSSYMSGSSFQWLQTLPISEEKLKKLGFMTVFRSLDLPLIALAVAFPLIMGIATQNIILALVCAVTSIPNVIFSFSILIFLSEKMARILYGQKRMSKKKSIIRMLTMLGYFIMAFSLGFIIQIAFSSIWVLFEQFMSFENISILNYIFSLIPYPFAPSLLVSLISTSEQIPLELWITTLIGYSLFIILSWGIYKIAKKSLKSVVASESKTKKIEEEEIKRKEKIEVVIETKSPIRSFIRKDLATASRDIQTFMFLLMPIVLPVITIISTLAGIDLKNIGQFEIIMIWAFSMTTCTYIPLIITSGLLNMEESGATILASLPLVPREQAKAKLILMVIIQTLSFLIAPLIIVVITQEWFIFLLLLASIPFSWFFLLLVFILKVRLFGKMKYKYVVEEVYKQKKILKWALIVGIEAGLFVIFFFFMILLAFFLGDLSLIMLITLIVGVFGTLICWYTFNRMFPKPEKMRDYKTGGALRETPILGVIVILVLYGIFLFIPEFAELLVLLPFIEKLPYIAILFIDFAFLFGFLALLLFYIVPFGLNLPRKNQTFPGYLNNIGLGRGKKLAKKILIGIGSFIIFSGIVLLGGILLGNYEFVPEILFSNPSYFNLGWFLFITMLIPGVWEEVAFRGVIIPNLERKYTNRSIILISGIAFGLAHSANFIIVLFGGNPLYTLLQLFYAACLGFSFAYMFLRTKSLYPSIILHYLVDSVGQLFLNVWFKEELFVILYLILFVGVFPMIGISLFVYFATKNERKFD